MANTIIHTAAIADHSRAFRSVVFVSALIGYVFLINSDSDLDYIKTTDGGKTWSAPVDLFTGSVDEFDVWYDQWTPGDTERCIHIWFVENGTDDVSYIQLNTVDDTETAVVDVFAGASTAKGRGTFVSGTKSRNGNLLCAFNMDAFAETGFYRSVDNGVTWSSRTTPLEANLDQCLLFPANAADPADIWALYDDDSTTQLTVKTYDDSANTWSESSAITFNNQATTATGQYGFSGSIRHQDGHLIFALFNDYDAVGEDFLCYDWDGTTLTKLTDLTTNIDDMYYPSVFLNPDQPNDIYIAYTGASSGAETLGTSVGVYYAKSTNRGQTWTKDIAMSSASSDWRQTWVPLNGERFFVVWMDISSSALMANPEASIDFGFQVFQNYKTIRASGQNSGVISVGG